MRNVVNDYQQRAIIGNDALDPKARHFILANEKISGLWALPGCSELCMTSQLKEAASKAGKNLIIIKFPIVHAESPKRKEAD